VSELRTPACSVDAVKELRDCEEENYRLNSQNERMKRRIDDLCYRLNIEADYALAAPDHIPGLGNMVDHTELLRVAVRTIKHMSAGRMSGGTEYAMETINKINTVIGGE